MASCCSRGRVIFDARPPMDAAEQIAARAGASAPGRCRRSCSSLWRLTGRRAPRLRPAPAHERQRGVVQSGANCSGNGSDGLPRPAGMDRPRARARQEAAADSGEAWDGKLTLLPFGGFEDCDRVYAVVEPGPDYGHVLAWKQGLPARLGARDARGRHDHRRPRPVRRLRGTAARRRPARRRRATTSPARRCSNTSTSATRTHGLSLELMDQLIAFYRRAMVDWRTPLADGTLAQDAPLARVALRHAIATDDAELVARAGRRRRDARRAAAGQRDRHRPGAEPRRPPGRRSAGAGRRAGGARCARLHRQRGLARTGRPAAGSAAPSPAPPRSPNAWPAARRRPRA